MALTLRDAGQRTPALPEMTARKVATTHSSWRNWIMVGAGLALGHLANTSGPDRLVDAATALAEASVEEATLIGDGIGYALGVGRPDRWIATTATVAAFDERHKTLSALRRAVDQGIGRAVWFLACAEPDKILEVMRDFRGHSREADVWGGVAYAGTYSGGATADQWAALLAGLRELGGSPAWIAQAVACAANARLRTSGTGPDTLTACAATWSATPEQTTAQLRVWLAAPESASLAAAAGGWRHVRAAIEFKA